MNYLRPSSSGAVTTVEDEDRIEIEEVEVEAQEKRVGGVKYSALGTVYAVDRPYFHADLTAAVEAAVRNARERDGWCSGASMTSRETRLP